MLIFGDSMFNWFTKQDNTVTNLPELFIDDHRSTSSVQIYKGDCHIGYILYKKDFNLWIFNEIPSILRDAVHPGLFSEELRQIADKIDELNSESE
jgi:hypothetical protein